MQIYTIPSSRSLVTGWHSPVASLRGLTFSCDRMLSRRHAVDRRVSPMTKAWSSLSFSFLFRKVPLAASGPFAFL